MKEEQNEMCPRCGATVVNPYKQREWVYLEREEIEDIWNNGCHRDDPMHAEQLFARAIEAKLKEKNAYGWQSVANPSEYIDGLRGGADLCGND